MALKQINVFHLFGKLHKKAPVACNLQRIWLIANWCDLDANNEMGCAVKVVVEDIFFLMCFKRTQSNQMPLFLFCSANINGKSGTFILDRSEMINEANI